MAEDAIQETLIKAWRGIAKFRGGALFSTWLISILANEVRMLKRKGDYRRLEYHDDLLPLERTQRNGLSAGQIYPVEDNFFRKEQALVLHEAIQKLPESLRCVLEYELLDQSIEVAACKLGITVAAVKSRRLRARQELQRRFGKRLNVL